jgi:ATP-binding cassette subfamily C protein LapB
LIDASISGVLINTIAIASAFYSMQIYDRVVPTGAQQTLNAPFFFNIIKDQ